MELCGGVMGRVKGWSHGVESRGGVKGWSQGGAVMGLS